MKLISLFLLALGGPLLAQTSVPAPAALPRPSGFKAVIETPHTAMYHAPGSVEQTRADTGKSFADAGWLPYGEAGETRWYKKGTIKASLTVGPSQGGKTMVSLAAEAMSADIPAPPGVTEIQYSDSTKSLSFATTQSPEDVDAAYRKLLAPAGWSTTMAGPVKDEIDYVVIYRHPSEGAIELAMRPGEGILRATATYQTLAEVEAEKARAAAQGDAIRAKLAAEANAPLPEVLVSLPQGTTKHFPINAGLAIKLTPGTAMAGAKKISAQLEAQGWKAAQPIPLVRETGMMELTRDNLRVSLVYMDPGMVPAEITISAPRTAIKVKP